MPVSFLPQEGHILDYQTPSLLDVGMQSSSGQWGAPRGTSWSFWENFLEGADSACIHPFGFAT